MKASNSKMYDTKHANLYQVWIDIKGRCYNENNKSYKYYGGRGIKLHDKWKNNFLLFYEYMILLPNYGKDGYSVDRIDNDGDYEPYNLRYATAHTQRSNRRAMKSKSGYTGITKSEYKGRETWLSSVYFNGTAIYSKAHRCLLDALWARNNYIIENELFEYPIQTYKDY